MFSATSYLQQRGKKEKKKEEAKFMRKYMFQ